MATLRSDLALLLDARGLPLQVPHVEELGAPHPPAPRHFDAVDDRRVERKDAFHPDAVRYLANGECRAHAPRPAGDDVPFEDLDPLLLALAHFHVHADPVAGPERRDSLLQAHRLDALHGFHGSPFFVSVPARSARGE